MVHARVGARGQFLVHLYLHVSMSSMYIHTHTHTHTHTHIQVLFDKASLMPSSNAVMRQLLLYRLFISKYVNRPQMPKALAKLRIYYSQITKQDFLPCRFMTMTMYHEIKRAASRENIYSSFPTRSAQIGLYGHI